ncbi:MAG: hypothetical protein R3195_08680 [Gemmatimonadota bacterium]|nr:hypothetical protein [Gemmatimonadota bacterium]
MLTQRTSSTLGGLALVLFGVAIGIAGDRLILSHHGGTVDHAEQQHEMALGHFQQLFDLDDAQVRQIDSIFRRHQTTVTESWSSLQPHLRTAIESVHNSMFAVLRPDQRERFHAWLEEQGAHGVMVIEHEGPHGGPERR